MATPEINFETALGELEDIVRRLESGENTLDESIALYERGMKLSRECAKRLESARQRIVTLTQAEAEEQADD